MEELSRRGTDRSEPGSAAADDVAHLAGQHLTGEVHNKIVDVSGQAVQAGSVQSVHFGNTIHGDLHVTFAAAELLASQGPLSAVEERIANLERDVALLMRQQKETVALPTAGRRPWCRSSEHQFRYWENYTRLLQAKGWTDAAIASIDASTTQVIARLARPSNLKQHQTKGMILGHPNSGVMTHIAGVVAKAIDSGYRLVIVLSGTTNLLRQQLQQRLDEVLPSLPDTPGIVRLTTREMDYRAPAERGEQLRFEKQSIDRPLNDPENLTGISVRLMVVKKNRAILATLIKDLQEIDTSLGEIPALIIDVDVERPVVSASSWPLRSAVGAAATNLVTILPRAQYVSITTSPFTSAFIDPSIVEPLFPRDFVVSLSQPVGYLGANELGSASTHPMPHDCAAPPQSRSLFVREVGTGDAGLREALDMFVLTGAVKAFRETEDNGPPLRHTMVVHGLMRRDTQDILRRKIAALLRLMDYGDWHDMERLRELFETDILPVSQTRAADLAVPDTFTALLPALRKALARIGRHPVSIEDEREPWKVIVADSKSEDRWDDEGPTIAYLGREISDFRAVASMVRWFGVRPGYHDLVRLYFTPSSATPDFRVVFEQLCRSDQEIREVLLHRPDLTPAMIPPLIAASYPKFASA